MGVRPETSADIAAQVNREAFGGDEEARLVMLLRQRTPVITSLVAVDDSGHVVGQIMFSPVTIVTGSDEMQVASLAPMAVTPGPQRRIGSRLVKRGLQECK